jgi:hypothetical protein
MLNTNMSAEMAQLMMENQERYVPQVEDETVPIFFDGDELTEERARNVQWAFMDGDDEKDRLKGLDPNHTDWHAKVTLYMVSIYIYMVQIKLSSRAVCSKKSVCFDFFNYLLPQIDAKMFMNKESSPDVGSSCASINRTGKTNAKKGPKNDYNAYKDFHDREIDAHFIASFIKFAGMKSING